MLVWRDLLRRPALTIAIPLHGAARWVDEVSANIAAAPQGARIVLSDRSQLDDALLELRGRHGTDRRVRYVEGFAGQGWREHVNELIAESSTPMFTILPQDDSIAPGHYERLVSALNTRPSAGLAFPTLRRRGIGGDDLDHAHPPFALGARPPWEEAIALRQTWNLGIPWRGVIRHRYLRPMLATPGDVWADLIWVFGIALETYLVEVPEAVYFKRYHDANTHGDWAPLPAEDMLRLQLAEVERRLGGQPDEEAAAAAVRESGTAVNGHCLS